jgi:hypothetical protein
LVKRSLMACSFKLTASREGRQATDTREARSAREVRCRAAAVSVGLGVSRRFALKGCNESPDVRLDFDLLPLERCDFFREFSNRRQTVTR